MHPSPTHSPPRPGKSRPARTSAALAVLSALLLVLVAAGWQPLLDLDRAVVVPLHDVAVEDPGLTQVSRVLTDWVWDPWTMRALTAVAVVWLLWQGAKLLALWVAATSVLGTLVQQVLKAAVDRRRPQWPDPVDSAHYAAFPSGHAMTAALTVGLMVWLLRLYGVRARWARTALALGVVSVLGVGLTRVHLGVHWPTDVIAGWLFGALTVTVAVAAYERRVGLAGSSA